MKKIVELINRLEKLINIPIVNFWRSITVPLKKLSGLILLPFKKIKFYILKLLIEFKSYLHDIGNTLSSIIGPRAFQFYKHKLQNYLERRKKIREEKIKNKEKLSSLKREFLIFLKVIYKKIELKIKTISPLKFATFGILFLIALLNSMQLLRTTLKLGQDYLASRTRSPASLVKPQPEYYNDINRTSALKAIKVPAFNASTSKIKNLEVDVNIRFQYRSSKLFFDKNIVRFQDRLQLAFEPIKPSFPLSPEGKKVLSRKIASEISDELKKNHQEDEVINVFFINIFAD